MFVFWSVGPTLFPTIGWIAVKFCNKHSNIPEEESYFSSSESCESEWNILTTEVIFHRRVKVFPYDWYISTCPCPSLQGSQTMPLVPHHSSSGIFRPLLKYLDNYCMTCYEIYIHGPQRMNYTLYADTSRGCVEACGLTAHPFPVIYGST